MIKRKYLITVSIAFAVALMLVSSTQASIGLPDYDSGWEGNDLGGTITLTHNLNTTEVLVYMVGKSGDPYYINQEFYGGYESSMNYSGCYWYGLDNTTIKIHRFPQDDTYPEFRVMIWKIEAQPQGQGVGGLTLPVDKLGLLVPYLALVATIILAVSISVAIIKHRKKQ